MWQQKLITPDHPPNEFGGSCSTHTGDSITTPNGTHHHHHSHRDNTLHSNLIRISKKCSDVFKKYEIVQVIGTGSMGTVSIVRIRDDKIGGSAFDHHHHHYSFSRYLGSSGLFGTQVNKIFGRNKQQQQRQRSPIRNDSNHNNNATTSSSSAIIIEDRPKKTHEYLYALKTIQLERITSSYVEELCNEIDILRTLDHPNIIKALEVYDSTSQNSYNNNSSKNSLLLSSLQRYNSTCHKQTKQIYMILELCTGGDLFQRSPYMILEAARLIDKLLNAIHYMHSMNIVHRDLKYENVLFETTTMDSEIKIIDFGLSKKFTYGTKPDPMTERVGTIYTMAPQVLQGVYSSQADMWSLGVMSYMLLSASKPFHHRSRKMLIDQIMRGTVKYDSPIWDTIDPLAKDFVSKLLVVDPRERMTAAQACKHEWITKRELLSNEKPSDDILSKLHHSFVKYQNTTELKKIALNVIAHKSTTADIIELRKVFDSFDKERRGVLTMNEFRIGLESLNYSDDVIQSIFSSIDINDTGDIMYTEFLAATLEAQGQIEEDRIAEAFDRMDCGDKGYITKKDIMDALGPSVTKAHVQEVIKDADYDRDGRISYQDFLRNFRENRHVMANKIAQEPTKSEEPLSSEDDVEDDKSLLGLDAKIPGGRFEIDTMCTI